MGYPINFELLKAENPAEYKKLAEKGLMIGFPVTVKGQSHRPDIQIPYHSTIKFFNPEKDQPQDVHNIAQHLQMHPPDPKTTAIEPGMFKDRFGNDVYVLKLQGQHADALKENNKKFSHMGYPANFEYQPHISLDKQTWDHVVASKAKTAHEAGITFGPAELRQGHSVVKTYKPPTVHHKEEKLAASEDLEIAILRETAFFVPELFKSLTLSLPDTIFVNWLNDNPKTRKEIIRKHEERVEFHFKDDSELREFALKNGIKNAYGRKK